MNSTSGGFTKAQRFNSMDEDAMKIYIGKKLKKKVRSPRSPQRKSL